MSTENNQGKNELSNVISSTVRCTKCINGESLTIKVQLNNGYLYVYVICDLKLCANYIELENRTGHPQMGRFPPHLGVKTGW
jgi:hypothetical protein